MLAPTAGLEGVEMVARILQRLVRSAALGESSSRERRLHERKRVRMKIQVIAEPPGTSTLRPAPATGRIEDISSGGARLRLSRPLASRRLWLRLPPDIRSAEFIECHVCWECGPQGYSSSGVQCGVRFDSPMDAEWVNRVVLMDNFSHN
jgi:PilZ domain